MIVQVFFLVIEILLDIFKLIQGVLVIGFMIKPFLMLHVEGLNHVESVQPHLARIDLLVPEIAETGSRLGLQRFHYVVNPFQIALFLCIVVQKIQNPAAGHQIHIVLLSPEALDHSVLVHIVLSEVENGVQISLLSRGLIQIFRSHEHAAQVIVPPLWFHFIKLL